MTSSSPNHFEIFGLPQTFAIDRDALDSAYRTLQAEVHPDRHAGGTDAERRFAMQMSARVNEAYRALKDPVERARHLLALRGIDAFDENDTSLAIDFLETQLSRRERAAEAAEEGDVEALDQLIAEVRSEIRQRQERLAQLLGDPSADREATTAVRELRFLTKVVEDVGAMVAALD